MSLNQEQAILGGILENNALYDGAAERLSVADFEDPMHRVIWATIMRLAVDDQPLDAVTVAETLERTGRLSGVGGTPYISLLAERAPAQSNFPKYVEALANESRQRQAQAVAAELQEAIIKPNGKDPVALMDELRTLLEPAEAEDKESLFWMPHELDQFEEDECVIDRWLPEGGIHILYSPKDCLKSFVAVDWFLCVASGTPWKGFPVKQGPCLYIAGEGARGLRKRFAAWGIRHQVNVKALPFRLSKMPMRVLDAKDISRWAAEIDRIGEDYGRAPALIVIDTLATNFGPGDENAPTDMAQFLAQLMIHIRRDRPITIVVVHHAGKDLTRGARGGSSLEANAEGVFTIEKIETEGEWDLTIKLKCKHIKDDEKPPDMVLKATPVELGVKNKHGDPLTSLVLEPQLTERELAVLNQTNAGKSQRQIADFLGLKSATPVNRILRRLKALGTLP